MWTQSWLLNYAKQGLSSLCMKGYILFHLNAHISSNILYFYILIKVYCFCCTLLVSEQWHYIWLKTLHSVEIKNQVKICSIFKEIFISPWMLHAIPTLMNTKCIECCSYVSFREFNFAEGIVNIKFFLFFL